MHGASIKVRQPLSNDPNRTVVKRKIFREVATSSKINTIGRLLWNGGFIAGEADTASIVTDPRENKGYKASLCFPAKVW